MRWPFLFISLFPLFVTQAAQAQNDEAYLAYVYRGKLVKGKIPLGTAVRIDAYHLPTKKKAILIEVTSDSLITDIGNFAYHDILMVSYNEPFDIKNRRIGWLGFLGSVVSAVGGGTLVAAEVFPISLLGGALFFYGLAGSVGYPIGLIVAPRTFRTKMGYQFAMGAPGKEEAVPKPVFGVGITKRTDSHIALSAYINGDLATMVNVEVFVWQIAAMLGIDPTKPSNVNAGASLYFTKYQPQKFLPFASIHLGNWTSRARILEVSGVFAGVGVERLTKDSILLGLQAGAWLDVENEFILPAISLRVGYAFANKRFPKPTP